MLRCTPFLLFDGNCAEALVRYHRCLGGNLTLTQLGDTPMTDQGGGCSVDFPRRFKAIATHTLRQCRPAARII